MVAMQRIRLGRLQALTALLGVAVGTAMRYAAVLRVVAGIYLVFVISILDFVWFVFRKNRYAEGGKWTPGVTLRLQP